MTGHYLDIGHGNRPLSGHGAWQQATIWTWGIGTAHCSTQPADWRPSKRVLKDQSDPRSGEAETALKDQSDPRSSEAETALKDQSDPRSSEAETSLKIRAS